MMTRENSVTIIVKIFYSAESLCLANSSRLIEAVCLLNTTVNKMMNKIGN